MENPRMPKKSSKAKVKAAQFLTLFFYLFPELPSVPRLGPYGHSIVTAPFPSCSQCFSPQDCACVSGISGPCCSVSAGGRTPAREGGGRQDKKHFSSTRAARHQLGQAIGWGGSALTESSRGAPTGLTMHLFILFFIARVPRSCGIHLGPPAAPHLFLPITLAFFGASFSCAFTQIYFSKEQEFLGIIFHFRVCSLFEAIPPLPYLCTISS